jgi:hypothetical protein
MKVLKYRSVFRFPGWRHTATQPEVPNEPRVVEKKIKKKALLIGIQQVREPTEITSPGLLKSPNGRSKWAKRRKQNTRSYLKGPHRDVRAMRELLISAYGRSFYLFPNADHDQTYTITSPKISLYSSTMTIPATYNLHESTLCVTISRSLDLHLMNFNVAESYRRSHQGREGA